MGMAGEKGGVVSVSGLRYDAKRVAFLAISGKSTDTVSLNVESDSLPKKLTNQSAGGAVLCCEATEESHFDVELKLTGTAGRRVAIAGAIEYTEAPVELLDFSDWGDLSGLA